MFFKSDKKLQLNIRTLIDALRNSRMFGGGGASIQVTIVMVVFKVNIIVVANSAKTCV